MKHKTWFRLVLKAIGVLLTGMGLPGMLMQLMQLSYFLQENPYSSFGAGMPTGYFWWTTFAPLVEHLGLVVIGLYLLFGGEWVVDKCIPSNRPYCPECGYDLSRASGERCPECGVSLPNVTVTDRSRETE